jgi:hypothetical protein
MQTENLVTESLETSNTQLSPAPPEAMTEITPLPLETFKLIGGGGGVIVE